jgi:type II secretion system protein H
VQLSSGRRIAVSNSRPQRRTAGFTLLEILLVLAIMGLMASVLIGGAVSLLSDKPVSAEEVFWKAVQEARKAALKSEHDVTLKFVGTAQDKVKEFVITNGDATSEFPIASPGDLEVSFLVAQKGGAVIMVAGTVIETATIPAVTFYPDGTCTAFRTQFVKNGGSHTVAIDPWTCAPVLTPADANGNSPSPTS